MTDLATEADIDLQKRTEILLILVEKLKQLPKQQGLGMALAIFLDLAKHHNLTVDKATHAVREGWEC